MAEPTTQHTDDAPDELAPLVAPEQNDSGAENVQAEAPEADEPQAIVVPMPEVATQQASTIGDENMEPRKPTVDVNQDSVPAQVMGEPAPAVETVPVHETVVATDRVIIDTKDPLAVQIPDAGRGNPALPIHSISGPTVEQVFAKHAADQDDS